MASIDRRTDSRVRIHSGTKTANVFPHRLIMILPAFECAVSPSFYNANIPYYTISTTRLPNEGEA